MNYESGNKCGKLLARSVREQKSATYIPPNYTHRRSKGHIAKANITGVQGILPLPIQFTRDQPQADIDEYILSSQMPSLPLEVQGDLDAPITLEELQLAVGAMKPGKATGPDGYTIQYYKTLLSITGPRMVTFFNAVGSETLFPRDTLKAHITLIHKERERSWFLWEL